MKSNESIYKIKSQIYEKQFKNIRPYDSKVRSSTNLLQPTGIYRGEKNLYITEKNRRPDITLEKEDTENVEAVPRQTKFLSLDIKEEEPYSHQRKVKIRKIEGENEKTYSKKIIPLPKSIKK